MPKVRPIGYMFSMAADSCSVSRKFSRLSLDSELWKSAYYRKFVLPKASRIPGIKEKNGPDQLHYSSRLSKWLDEGHLVKDGVQTNWKQQYRLRHNWAQGQCTVDEIVVAERAPDPPLLVMMSNNIVYAADSINGLRAWSLKDGRGLLAHISLDNERNIAQLPVSMAIDAAGTQGGPPRVVLGFHDGAFSIYSLRKDYTGFDSLFAHPSSVNGMLSALAYSSPYLLTMTEDHLLSLYTFAEVSTISKKLKDPRLLYSLRSHTAWPPVTLSLRTTMADSITIVIAYCLPTYLSGWTVGVQELKLSTQGKLLDSRLATAADEHAFTLSTSRSASSPSTRSSSPRPENFQARSIVSSLTLSKPTSTSYAHPYLLIAHPDNTLSLFLVRSTSSGLSISTGNRLWGHTSSISGAHVGLRGKAVSVSRLGDELRIWDLEGGMVSLAARKRLRKGEMSVRVQPSKSSDQDIQDGEPKPQSGLKSALEQGFDDSTVSLGWAGFDEQNVIVLREKSKSIQSLVVYDFT